MIYLETGKMSWDESYGMGRYINELVKRGIYQYVLCAKSQAHFVPKIHGLEVIALDDIGYRDNLSEYILNHMDADDVVHFPANLICANIDSIPNNVKLILTVHDITPIFYYKNKRRNGNFFSDGESVSTRQFEENLREFLPRVDHVITVSENTKKDIISYFNIEGKKISVVYNGIDAKFIKYSKEKLADVKKSYHLENEKLVMVLTGGKHKNIIRVVVAFYFYCILNKNEDIKLILVGKTNKKMVALTYFLRRMKKAVLTGRVSDEVLVDYYNIVDSFIFASLYEGFGLPLLEAMACGSFVICSDNSSLGELGRGYAYLINPRSIKEIMNGFSKVKKLSDNEIGKQREYIGRFTWDNSANQHEVIINNLVNI